MENNSDMFSSSTAPLTWHDFLERMRQPSAAEFVKAIKSFIVSFSNNAPDPERDSTSVQQFLANMEAAFRAHSLWAGCSEEELESAGEGLEKYVMTKLFTRVFASLPDDVKVDEQLSEKMALVQQFIRPENLDIQPTYQNETSWLLAQKELQKINMYKAPREKLACILNCCKVITNLLLNASTAANENPPGADEFLPVLIFVTLKANPPQLHSNLLYIQRYRRQTRLVAESAYYFTNMLSAESFILNIDANAISMDESEFERNMESARAVLCGLSSDYGDNSTADSVPKSRQTEYKQQASVPTEKDLIRPPQVPAQPSGINSGNKEEVQTKDQSSVPRSLSISDFEEKGASMLLKEDSVNKVFQEFPFLFANSGDLTVSDVEDLLNNYKQLVFRYVSLAKGLGGAPPYFRPSISPSDTQSHAKAAQAFESNKSIENGDGMCADDVKKNDHAVDGTSQADVGVSEPEQPDPEVANLPADDGNDHDAETNSETLDVKGGVEPNDTVIDMKDHDIVKDGKYHDATSCSKEGDVPTDVKNHDLKH